MLVPALAISPLGPSTVAVCPKFVVGGLLVHLGLGYLMEGLWDPRHLIAALEPSEYAVILVIFAASVLVDLSQAMLIGFLLLSFLFVIRYGQGEVVQFACCAEDWPTLRSNRYRSEEEWERLVPHRSQLSLVRANCSHLFFGSISTIMSAAPRVSHSNDARCFVILDLSTVRTMDSSALAALQRHPSNIMVCMAQLRPELAASLREASVLKSLRCFDTLDLALEFCEDQLLHDSTILPPASSPQMTRWAVSARSDKLSLKMTRPLTETKKPAPLPMDNALATLSLCFPGAPRELLQILMEDRNGSRLYYVKGAVVAEEGSTCMGMLICLRGSLTLYSGPVRLPQVIDDSLGLNPDTKKMVGLTEFAHGSAVGGRVRSLGPGDSLGDLALVTRSPLRYNRSLVADESCEILLIRREVVLTLEASTDLRPALELQKTLAAAMLAKRVGDRGDQWDHEEVVPLKHAAKSGTHQLPKF